MANIIEIVLRGVDQTGALEKGFTRIKQTLVGLGAFQGLRLLTKNIEEAEDASAQLDAAFKATGRTAGITRKELDELAVSLQRTTKFSDDLVREAEAVLLTFTRVRGEAFERTIKVSSDLASRMRTDLVSAVRQVGTALQDPARGLDRLRRAGVVLESSQRSLILRLAETGQTAKAQSALLAELERRFEGSAEAARSTLSGAIAGLKNSLSDLFEGDSSGAKELAGVVNRFSEIISDPKFKKGVDGFISGLAGIGKAANQLLGYITPLVGKIGEFINAAGDLGNIIDNKLFGRQLDDTAFRRLYGVDPRGTGPSRRYSRGSGIEDVPDPGPKLEEVNVTVKRIVDRNADILQQLVDQTKTAAEKTAGEYTKLKETLDFLRDNQLITGSDYNKRNKAALDELLPEFDLNEIKAKYITLKKATDEFAEFTKGAFQAAGASVQGFLADIFYQGRGTFRDLVNIARRAAADIAAAFATAGVKKGLVGLGGLLFGGGGGGTGLEAFLDVFSVPKYASGTDYVPQDGLAYLHKGEKVVPSNKNSQLSGAKINFSPQVTFQLVPTRDPREDKEEIYTTVATMFSQWQTDFIGQLQKAGVDVRG